MASVAVEREELVEALARLSPAERAGVFAAAHRRAAGRDARVHVSWATLHAVKGLVRLGGNALEDCRRLYDRHMVFRGEGSVGHAASCH